MNKERRSLILRAQNLVGQARELLEEARDAEQEAFDNMPEGLQSGERGQQMEMIIDRLGEWIDQLEEVESGSAEDD